MRKGSIYGSERKRSQKKILTVDQEFEIIPYEPFGGHVIATGGHVIATTYM